MKNKLDGLKFGDNNLLKAFSSPSVDCELRALKTNKNPLTNVPGIHNHREEMTFEDALRRRR